MAINKKSGKIHKNREKKLQFYGIKQSKIQWMVIEIKFIKGEKFLKIWETINQKVCVKNLKIYIKIEKKFCNLMP